MAIKFLSSENVQGNIDVVLSQNAITYLAVSNVNTGVSANARVQVVGESAQFDIIASSAGYTGVAGWADAGIISTDSGASGGLILNSVGGIVKIQTAQTTALSFDSSQIASFTEDVNIADGKKLHFGAASPSGDLRIYHVADSNSYIEEHGAGALVFKSNDYYFQSTASVTVLQVIPGAGIITTGYGTFSGSVTSNAIPAFLVGTIGAIGNTANDVNIYSTTAGHNGLRMHVNGILPTDNAGTIIDNDADLGDPSYRFKDGYFAGDVNITQATDVGVLNVANLDSGAAVGLSLTYPTTNVAAGDGLAIAIGIAGRGRSYIANSNVTTNLDASNLVFYTEDGGVIGERMIIESDGNVGIGTTSPTGGKLQIEGADDTSLLHLSLSGGYSKGSLEIDDPYFVVKSTSNTTGGIKFRTITGGTIYDRMTILNAGNVGIGTDSPASEANLSLGGISAAEGGHLVLFKGTAQTYATHMDNYGNTFRMMSGSDTASTAVQFSINHSTAAATFTGTIDSGNINISDGTPELKLTDTSSSATFKMVLDGVNTDITNSGTNGDITFHTHNGEKFRMNEDYSYFSNCDVGIGTSSPNATLEVDAPSTTAPSLTMGAVAGQIFTNEDSELAFGLDNAAPYNVWMQSRFNGNASRPLLINPLGGNVGIGTDSPDTTLHLYNAAAGDVALKIETSSGGDPTLYLTSETVNRSGIISFQDNGVNAGRIIYSHNGDTMDFYTAGLGASHLELSLNESSGATFRTTGTFGDTITSSKSTDAGIGGQLKLINPHNSDNVTEIQFEHRSSGTATSKIESLSVSGGNNTKLLFKTESAGTLATRLTLDESGDATFAGTVTATGDVIAYSDERLKDNIKTLDGSKVYKMRGVSFDKNGKKGSGVIAQELEKIAPELVNNDSEYKGVAYGNLVGYLIEAIKELKAEIEELKKNK